MVAFAVAPAVAAVGMGALRSIPQVIPRLVGMFSRGMVPRVTAQATGRAVSNIPISTKTKVANELLMQNQAARSSAIRSGLFPKGTTIVPGTYQSNPLQSKQSKATQVIQQTDQSIPSINFNQALANVTQGDQIAYGLGRGLNAVSIPFGGPVGLGITAAFTAPMFLPQGQPQPDEMYGYYPNGQYPVDPGMVQFQSLTDEQIVKARRRMEENAQLNAIYANALSQYEM